MRVRIPFPPPFAYLEYNEMVMKYLSFELDDKQHILIFSKPILHSEMWMSLQEIYIDKIKLLGAGVVEEDRYCSGVSDSLNIQSRYMADSLLIDCKLSIALHRDPLGKFLFQSSLTQNALQSVMQLLGFKPEAVFGKMGYHVWQTSRMDYYNGYGYVGRHLDQLRRADSPELKLAGVCLEFDNLHGAVIAAGALGQQTREEWSIVPHGIYTPTTHYLHENGS